MLTRADVSAFSQERDKEGAKEDGLVGAASSSRTTSAKRRLEWHGAPRGAHPNKLSAALEEGATGTFKSTRRDVGA